MIEILEALGPLVGLANNWIPAAGALLARMSLLILMMPGFGGVAIPTRIRLILALLLVLLILPLTDPIEAETAGDVTLLLLGEAIIGFILGFSVRVFVFALNITGTIIAQAMSLSQIFGVTLEGDSSSLVATVLTTAAATLFLTADLEVAMIGLLVQNLEVMPLGGAALLVSGAVAEQATRAAADALAFGITLAVPFMVMNFAYYLVLGFLNRAMPQLMVTFVGIPAITLSGLILFTLAISGLLALWLSRVSGAMAP
ncbi:MAG: flagellar biosynthetic protein FliR [Pseudomonadota bacterium]